MRMLGWRPLPPRVLSVDQLLQRANDTRTPLEPILKYAMKLLELGKTFELHMLPDAGHAVTRMDDALKLLLPAAIFLEKYLAR
ncbi:MAG: prolyl oligopeptidase family serine peptidase [Thermofilum sp.]|nr:prolyl oligopeptidase family serine peptidase [Thermofilum sp.]MCC6065497.1 prolyl oligopeptidase family serine peptidase [Thermofilum sp.]